MSNIGCLLWGLNLLTSLSIKYKRISDNPEYKATTGYFGIYAIVTSILVGGLFVLSLWGVIALINGMDNAGISTILLWVFIAMLVIVALFLFAEYILGGLMGVIYQFRCNRRPIAWVALAVFIITAAAMAVGIIFIFGITGIQS